MLKNPTLEKIRNGETAFGLASATGDPILLEVISRAGFDWLWIETQHGYWDYNRMLAACQILGPDGPTPIIRPASNDYARIGLSLDCGGMGLVVPMVNSVEDAEAAVYNSRYAPVGGRSSGGGRTWMVYGDDYAHESNDEILLAVMIETPAALERVNDIAAVKGIDALFIGPWDLAFSMGVESFGEEHEAAIQKILDASTNAGLPCGFPCGDVDAALRRADQGFRLVHCGSELGMVRNGIAAATEALGLA